MLLEAQKQYIIKKVINVYSIFLAYILIVQHATGCHRPAARPILQISI